VQNPLRRDHGAAASARRDLGRHRGGRALDELRRPPDALDDEVLVRGQVRSRTRARVAARHHGEVPVAVVVRAAEVAPAELQAWVAEREGAGVPA